MENCNIYKGGSGVKRFLLQGGGLRRYRLRPKREAARAVLTGGILLWLSGCGVKKTPDPLPLADNPPPPIKVHLRPGGGEELLGASQAEKQDEGSDLLGPEDLWQRLFQGYRFPERDVHRPRVQAQIRYYLKKREDGFFDRVQRRARPLLYMIVSEIERAGMPTEIALLPVVESAFKTTAYSRAGASGLWQFIPSTGRRYGLGRNYWVDLRRDPVAATEAAIRYLKELYAMFGDWYLALAAYNCGEKRVQAAIEENRRRGLPTDFWHLDLPRETENYVPRLIAVSHIFKHAQEYGIALRPIPNRPLFATISIDGPLDLEVAARLAGLTLEEIYQLNAAYRRGTIPPFGGKLLLPLERASDFKRQLAALPVEKRHTPSKRLARSDRRRSAFIPVKYGKPHGYRHYRVRRGDTLASIARRYGTSIAELKRINHLRGDRLYVGQLLKLPRGKLPSRSYRVRRGETLASIARRYGISVAELKRINGLKGNAIYVGQRLKVPATSTRPEIRYHKVRRGETLYRIARRYGVSVEALKRWNRIRSSHRLRVGQRLKIYF